MKARQSGMTKYRPKPIPKKNVKALKNKRARYDEFMRSPEWKALRVECMERAENRCEYMCKQDAYPLRISLPLTRCPMTTTLTAHHLRYTRFGGKELPSDLQCLCKSHHDYVESLKPGNPLWKRAS